MLRKRNLLTKDDFSTVSDKSVKLYPKFDETVFMRSCKNEVIAPVSGELQGSIPEWLNGCLLRNSPGNLNVGDMQFDHVFDGAALVHKFNIKNGMVTYQSRFIQSETFKKNMNANRIVVSSFGTKVIPDPCHTIFNRIASIFQDMTDNTNVSIYPMGDEFYAFTDGPIIQRINVDTLDTIARLDIRKFVGVINHTAHPFVMNDNSVYNLGVSAKNFSPKYNIIHFPNGVGMFENASIVAKIPIRWTFNPSYMHSFAITDNYFIIIEQPFSISVMNVLKAKYYKLEHTSIFKWFPNKTTIFHVICRKSGKRKFAFETAPLMFFHTINAFETKNHIILDICCYRDPSFFDCMYIEALKNMQSNKSYAEMFRSRPLRFVLPTKLRKPEQKSSIQLLFSLWNNLKAIVFRRSGISKKEFLKKHLSDGKIIDLWKFESKFWLDFERQYTVENLVKMPQSEARAYSINDSNVFCVPEHLCNVECELPRINEKQSIGKKYKFFYAVTWDVKETTSIIKVDTENKSVLKWSEYNVYPSEPIFVPAPNSETEDDGVVLSSIIWGNGDTNRAGLLVLCAKTFKELGRCVFNTPEPVSKCLHGWYHPS